MNKFKLKEHELCSFVFLDVFKLPRWFQEFLILQKRLACMDRINASAYHLGINGMEIRNVSP